MSKLQKLVKRTPYVFDPTRMHMRPAEQIVFEVGDDSVSVRQLLRAFPQVYKSPTRLDLKLTRRIYDRFFYGALIMKDVRVRGLIGDRRLARAREMADVLVRGLEARRLLMAVPTAISDEQVQAFYDDNPERLAFVPQHRVLELTAAPIQPEQLSPGELVLGQAQVRAALDGLLQSTLIPGTTVYRQKRAEFEKSWAAELGIEAIHDQDIDTSPAAFLACRREMMRIPKVLRQVGKQDTDSVKFTLRDRGVIILPQPREIAEFKLVDTQGEPFTVERLRGAWSFIFFGFTNCPDICPTSMSVLAQAERLFDLYRWAVWSKQSDFLFG